MLGFCGSHDTTEFFHYFSNFVPFKGVWITTKDFISVIENETVHVYNVANTVPKFQYY